MSETLGVDPDARASSDRARIADRDRPTADRVAGGEEPAGLRRARVLARVMDASVRIPLTRRTFGLDAILGLVPGLGDAVGAAVAAYIVGVGVRLGASRSVVLRMVGNVALETIAGTVPAVGDLFDAVWKANVRNVDLLERHLADPARGGRLGRILLVGIAAVFILLVAGTVWISLRIAGWVFGLFPFSG